jgi:uridylate kinase
MAENEEKKPDCKRIIYKLSGEALRNRGDTGAINQHALERTARELIFLSEQKIQLGVVVGGGNILRGRDMQILTEDTNIGPAAHQAGILATMINSIILHELLRKMGANVRMQTAETTSFLNFPYQLQKSLAYLEKGCIVIFAAGTGDPYHTTDHAAVVRALEMKADAIFKGTKVNGIYRNYPPTNPNEKPIPELTRKEALELAGNMFDVSALHFLNEHKMNTKIHIFNTFETPKAKPENKTAWKILTGEKIGTVIVP